MDGNVSYPQSSINLQQVYAASPIRRQDIVHLVHILSELKNKGLGPSDPRYLALLKILKMAQLYISLAKKQQQNPNVQIEGLSSEQLNALRAQLIAHRHLTRNMPVPEDVLRSVKPLSSSSRLSPISTSTSPSPSSSTPILSSTSAPTSIQTAIPTQNQTLISTSNTSLNPNSNPSAVPQLNNVPAPSLLDANLVIEEREKRIQERIKNRLAELKRLLPSLSESQKTNAMIEIKKLELLDVQKKLRNSIAEEMTNIATLQLATSGDRTLLRRLRKTYAQPEPPVTERIEMKKREDEREYSRQKRRDFVNAVLLHQRNFKDFYTERSLFMKKLTRQILKYHQNKEKREQIRREREEKELLQALKANDEEAYLRLLEKKKNERLKLLLDQTDQYLREIGAAVEKEQEMDEEEWIRSGDKTMKQDKSKDKLKEKEKEKEKEKTKEIEKANERKPYFQKIHKIQEEIKEQPKLLSGGTLKEYQLVGLQWLVSLYNNRLNGILADEMGLGKTIQTIALICYLMETKGNYGPYMIIVPLSTIANWELEFDRWAPKVTKIIFKGTPPVRKRIYQNRIVPLKFNVLLTTYEYVIKDKNMLSKVKWNYIIVDEGHRMKNHNCKLSTYLQKHYSSQHRLILTGTPLQNSLPELWSLLNFLLPNIFNSCANFEQWFNAPFAAAGEKVEMNEVESLLVINRLHKVLRPFLLRRLKKDVESQLPDKIEKVLKCEMSAMQRKMYEHMRTRGVVALQGGGDGKIGVRSLMNSLMQLRKICNHPYLFSETSWTKDDNLWRASGKVELLDRLLPKLQAFKHRVLIFTQMTKTIDILEDYFQLRNYKYLRLDGSTKSEERGELLKKFNADDSPYFIFVLSTRAGGLGLNLQAADTVILFDSDWNPQMDIQAQDRAHRIGQKNEVRVFRLITVNSIEERILERANFKLDIDQKIIEAGMFNKKSTASDRRSFLLNLLQKEKEEEGDGDVIPDDTQINQMLARTDEEFVAFEQMDRERIRQEKEEARRCGRSAPRPRLMEEDELPEWLKVDLAVALEEKREDERYGRGRRTRNPNVVYNIDDLSEEAWLKLIEKGEDPNGGAEKRTVKRKSEPTESDDGENMEQPKPKKIRVDQLTPGNQEEVKLQTKPRTRLHRKLRAIWKTIKRAKDETGRLRSLIFMELPSKEEYPDYYLFIKKPICMNQIKNKEYSNPQEFYDEFMLMFRNAQDYNMPGSQVYTDAVTLQELFQQEYGKFLATYNPVEDNQPESEEEKRLRRQKKKEKRAQKQRQRKEAAEPQIDSIISTPTTTNNVTIQLEDNNNHNSNNVFNNQVNNMGVEEDGRACLDDDDPDDYDFQVTDEDNDQ
jgi:SNF2 family DNA or RNA helicase